jgi:tol-pal system protein YbgF
MHTRAISLALLACGCAAYPKERGERVEQRVQRLEEGGDTGQLEAERATAQKKIQELEGRVAELQKRIDALSAARQQGGAGAADATARRELTDELTRQSTVLEDQGRRVAAMEKTLAQLQTGEGRKAATASARTPKSAAPPRAAAEPPPRPGPGPTAAGATAGAAGAAAAAGPPGEKAGVLALARQEEAKGQTGVARDLYEQYVTSFPDDPGAAEAHFRLGELAFGERRYRDAIGEYGKVAQRFPKSSQAPDALLRTADSMAQMGLKDDAATVLAEIPKRYPQSAAASKASRRLAELGGGSDTRR